MKKCKSIFAIMCVLWASGCVTGTRNIELSAPIVSPAESMVGTVQIVSISDKRVFEQKPSIPEIPSSKRNVEELTETEKSMLVGRQRNGYGGAMGDVALGDGQSVQGEIRSLLTNALAERGYQVVDNADKKLTVDINKFWAWMVPGFISVGFESEIETVITLEEDAQSKTETISVKANNEGQVASNANWELSYERAFVKFMENLKLALEKMGL